MSHKTHFPEEIIWQKILTIRNQKVMLDRDLATLYGVETKRLKEAIRRNRARFPSDFMFELNEEEFLNLRTQFASSSYGGNRYVPFAFTEQGIAMLSSVLNTDKAIAVNIQIIRLFTKMRAMLLTHKDLLIKMEELEKRAKNQDENIAQVFNYLKQFVREQESEKAKIGYKNRA